jgi:predicted HTH transcriptional regulator
MLPVWADEPLSKELPTLRAKGEGQDLEFKEAFPRTIDELAKEVASFATAGGGTILMGVANNGELVGLEAPDGEARDILIQRLQGVFKIPKPPVSGYVRLGSESARTIAALVIPAQEEPLYYVNHVPYVRDGHISRPVEPDEVKALVWRHPSSEFRRRMENVQLEQAETLQRMRRQFADQSAERNQMADQAMFRRLRP